MRREGNIQVASRQERKADKTPLKSRKKAKRTYSTSGLYALKRAIRGLDMGKVDRRYKVFRALAEWRSELISDLGGQDGLSRQQLAIVDLAVKSKLLLDSVDAWLLAQPSLINARKKSLLPALRERTQLADSLARYMTTLGLERKAKPVPALAEYVEQRYQANGRGRERGA